MKNSVFRDKATLVLRQMLRNPDTAWVVRDFQRFGVGRGWAARVLSMLRDEGFLKGKPRGRAASSLLRDGNALIREWIRHYRFEQNSVHAYYSHAPSLLPAIKRFFAQSAGKDGYALTLHTGANLITNFVRSRNLYLYLDATGFEKMSLELRQALDLKQLKEGGNVYVIKPVYKKSVFDGVQRIKGYPIVSNLQLYLDLYHFPERGREHADYLLRVLAEKGLKLA